MKVVVALAALIVVAAAQHHDHGLVSLINHEVDALVAADGGLTTDACTTKCDALFDLVDDHDEQATDRMCHEACACKIDNQCAHHQPPSTHAPHHTHPTHPPHP